MIIEKPAKPMPALRGFFVVRDGPFHLSRDIKVFFKIVDEWPVPTQIVDQLSNSVVHEGPNIILG